jgi:hypothetical protein
MLFALLCQVIINSFVADPIQTFPSLVMNLGDYGTPITNTGDASPNGELTDLMNIYKEVVKSTCDGNVVETSNGNVTKLILESGKKDISAYRNSYMVAAEFEFDFENSNNDFEYSSINVVFNSLPYHTPPTALNLVTKALLQFLSNDDDEYDITVTSHPLDSNEEVRIK